MTAIGPIVLLGAFLAAVYAAVASIAGARRNADEFIESGRRAALAVTGLIALASLALLWGLVTRDFRFAYVVEHTSRATPWYFALSAFYSGQQGSLLYWSLALSIFSSVVILQNRRRYPALMPYVTATLMLIQTFFLLILVFVAGPFDRVPAPVADGQGLNPLLQDPGMLIHPPMLLAGLMSWSVPFAFVAAALVTGRLGNEWIRATRRYALVAWCILGCGNLLGAWWSYHVLGWGGYWGWDPVENAAIMPWLVGTAYLHSSMVQERRGMLKVWNAGLLILAFCLSIFGTFVVRSGVLNSVHSFAESSIGPFFFVFLAIVVIASLSLLYWRMPLLQSNGSIESSFSREGAFLLNNLLLVGIVFATFWGTVLPLLSEALHGAQMTVGAPFFNQVNGPIALALVLLMGIGPLLPWRRGDHRRIARSLLPPTIVALITGAALWLASIHDPLPLIAFAACAFVLGSIALEFWTGISARRSRSTEGYALALRRLVRRNNRRYGGYVVHLGIILVGLGIVGSSFFKSENRVILQPGQSAKVAGFTLTYQGLKQSATADSSTVAAPLDVSRAGQSYPALLPSKVTHRNFEDQPPTSGVAIDSVHLQDLYVVLTDYSSNGTAGFLVFLNPLVSLIWMGGPVFLLGFLICMWPEPRPRPRTPLPVSEEVLVGV
jgi:cytochrome c-type biogenesis protein CcmF